MSSIGITAIASLSNTQRAFAPAAFYATGVTISQTDIDTLLASILSAGRYTFPTAGKCIGISWEANAALGAGTLQLTIFKNGTTQTPATNVTSVSGTRGRNLFTTPISFADLDALHVKYSTNAAVTLLTTLVVFPLIVLDT